MNTIRFTQILCVVTIAVLSAVDIWLAVNRHPEDTISVIMRRWSSRWFVMPWAWGVLGGHFFGPELPGLPDWTALGLIPMALAMTYLGWARVVRVPVEGGHMLWLVLFGIACGALLWPIDT